MQKSSGSNNQDVKQKNRMLVLKLITVNKGISRVDIAKMTGLSKMTVGNIVTELIEQGIVTEKALPNSPLIQNSTGNYGRKPDRKSTRLNSSHSGESRMPSSA